jgi:predicted NUDIX family NTP pyrophosphohydrolase
MKVQNHSDVTFLQTKVGTVVQYPDRSKEMVIFKTTDRVGKFYLTQIQTNNIKKNGELGKLTTWLKFKHYKLA